MSNNNFIYDVFDLWFEIIYEMKFYNISDLDLLLLLLFLMGWTSCLGETAYSYQRLGVKEIFLGGIFYI